MAPIRKGDGTPLEIPGVSEVRSGDGRVFFEGDAIPDSGIAQYLFDEGSETTFGDKQGDADGTLIGAGWQEDSQAVGGWMAEFDGVDDYGQVDQEDQPSVGAQGVVVGTFEMVDVTVGRDPTQDVFYCSDEAGDRVRLIVRDQDKWSFVIADVFEFDGVQDVVDGEKIRFGIGWDDGDYSVRIDGSEVDNGTYGDTVTLNAHDWQVGGETIDDGYSNVRIDNLVIDNSYWSAQEWQDDYDAQPWS